MNRSVIRSVFEHLADNLLLLVFPAALLLYLSSYHVTALVLGAAFYFVSVKDASVIPAVAILLCFMIPPGSDTAPISEGYVREVRENYVVVESGHSKILVYTKSMPIFDSVIRFDGHPEPVSDSKGFYRFPFAHYSRLKGIRYAVSPDTITEVKASYSVRGFLMKRIMKLDPEVSSCLMKVLFSISSSDESFSGLLRDRGISLAGVIAFTDCMLSYFCFEERRKTIRFVLILILGFFYHWPFLLVQRSLRIVLKRIGLNSRQAGGAALLISLRLFPYAVFSASFLMPLIYMFADDHKQGISRMFFGMHASAVLFQKVNPAELFLFRRLLPLSGFCWFCALAEALFRIPLHGMILLIDRIYSVLFLFELPGTIFGPGLPFYLLMQISLNRKKKKPVMAAVLFLLFQFSGLFHPFAELSFINVGQGDSILIRSPFRTGDVLIDTGKPSQKNNVFTFLKAKGIHSLDTLLITHADSDHSGNQEAVTEEFSPSSVITAHHPPFTAGVIHFLDLNDIHTEDENESSIVTAFRLNGLFVLLMGDSSVLTEERILQRYPDLSCDILKLSHHGSKTGSSERFLDTVRPELAIVSSGAYSIYHHPSPEVTERLYNRRIPYLDTKEDGDITILFLPGFNLLTTASGKIAIIRV